MMTASAHPESPRTALVDEPPTGNLHHEVRDEQRSRQEADDPEADAIRLCQHVGGRSDVRDVVADGRAERDTGAGRCYVARVDPVTCRPSRRRR